MRAVREALVVLVLVASAAEASVIGVRAQPDVVVLGVDKRVVLTIDGGGVFRGVPRTSATAGVVREVENLGGGRFRALYEPPADGSPPQVALIAVWDSADVTKFGHVAIPVHANLSMQLEAAARATIVVTVGPYSSPPATANKRGEVTATVRIPPGYSNARIVTTFPNGKQTVSEEPLNIPSWNRVRLIVGATEVVADGRAAVPIRAVATTVRGQATVAGVGLSATHGVVTNVRRDGPYLAATYTSRVRGSSVTDTIVATLAGDVRSGDRRTIELRPVELRDFTVSDRVLRLSDKVVPARFAAVATLRSANKVAVSGERVIFTADVELGRPRVQDLGNGRYEAVFSVPREREDEVKRRGKVVVRVVHAAPRGRSIVAPVEAEFAAYRLGLVTAVAMVTKTETVIKPDGTRTEVKVEVPVDPREVRPPPVVSPEVPVEVSIHLDPETIRANGQTSRLVVHLFDDDGKPVSGKVLKVVASAGAVKRVTERASGFYFAEYEAPTIVDKARTEFPVQVRVTSDDHAVSYRESISIESSLAADFPAAEKKFRIGTSFGAWIPFGIAFGFALDVDFTWRLPIWDRNFYLIASTGAYFPQDALDVKGQSGTQKQRIFPLVGGLLYRRTLGKPWFSIHGGLSAGFYFVDEEVAVLGTTGPQFSLLVGFQAPFGAEFRVGPGTIPLAIRYHHTILRQPEGGGFRISGTVQGFTVTTGYRVEF